VSDDRESKSNEPTEKKINDTIAKGNVPVSREVPVLFSYAAILVVCSFLIAPAVGRLETQLGALVEGVGTIRLNTSIEADRLFETQAGQVFGLILPILLSLLAGGVVAALVQNPFQINLERILPQFSRVSPSAGFGRIFGFRGFGDFLKSLFKFLSIGLIVALIIESEAKSTFNMMIRPPQIIPNALHHLVIKLVSSVTITALVLAVVDTVWSRIAWRRDLRMSHQEIKEEHKDAEGNPMVKVRARSLARQRSSRRMMSAVPKATLVIANPTHYAIALRYVIALRIREIAEKHEIAVIENKPMARAMYEKVEVNSEIPQEFFMAVAELIHFLQMKSMARTAEARGN
jgi:flagellar biosynthesis protein FlhB